MTTPPPTALTPLPGHLPLAIRHPRATRSAWLIALLLGTSSSAALAWLLHTYLLPRLRTYLTAVTNLRLAQAQAHAALARLAATQHKFLKDATRSSAQQLALGRALGSTANQLVYSPPDEDGDNQTTPTQVTANYPTQPPQPPRPDPAAFLAGYTADWLAQVLVASSVKSPLSTSSFGSAVARWNPTGHPMANILGCDMAIGLREAVEKCRSEVRLVRSAALSPRRVSSLGGIKQQVNLGGWRGLPQRGEVGGKHVGLGRPSVLGVFGKDQEEEEEGRKAQGGEGEAGAGSISVDE